MPLFEDEQRILREIEANLSVTDPKLVQQVSDTTLYRHSAKMIKWALLVLIVGLTVLVMSFTSVLPLAVCGFLLMLFCLLVIEHHVRKMGRAGLESLTASRGGAMKGVFGGAGKRWRERWQRDDDPS